MPNAGTAPSSFSFGSHSSESARASRAFAATACPREAQPQRSTHRDEQGSILRFILGSALKLSIPFTSSFSSEAAMSWDDQLNNLKARGLAHAAICDKKDASWFVPSPGSNVSMLNSFFFCFGSPKFVAPLLMQ